MNDIAISVDGLGKEFHLGARQQKYKTLRESMTDVAMGPMRAVRRMVRQDGSRAPRGEILWALKDLSFEVKRGEVVGIIGRNGAGKSTLLKILSRITEPSVGSARIHGRVGSLLEVGTGFHPELSGRENIYLNGAILGMRRAEIDRRFDEIVDFAEVEKFIDTAVKHYSSGMYLRLAFAVAAYLEPEILLVDEVLAVGDASFQKKCLGKMGDVAREGRTVLFVSHNMSAVGSLTNRCIALKDGQIYRDGPSYEVIRQHLSDASTAEGKMVWDEMPVGHHSFSLTQCQIGDGLRTEFSSDDTISITFDFTLKRPVQGLRVGLDVVSQEGIIAFRAYQDDNEKETSLTLGAGSYQSKCVMPANLFNQGEYYITVRVGIIPTERLCVLEQVMRFSVINLNGPNSQYGADRPGVFNPSLHWNTMRKE